MTGWDPTVRQDVRTFRVGISSPGVSGGGDLYIAPGILICYLSPLTRRIAGIDTVQHHGAVVDVYYSRLMPFWFDTTTRLDDGRTPIGATTWSFARRQLIRTLTAAGFTVHLHRTWFSRGE